MEFSTIDVDNDLAGQDCAWDWISGFWFNACTNCNPTGVYGNPNEINAFGMTWETVFNNWYTFKEVTMMIK